MCGEIFHDTLVSSHYVSERTARAKDLKKKPTFAPKLSLKFSVLLGKCRPKLHAEVDFRILTSASHRTRSFLCGLSIIIYLPSMGKCSIFPEESCIVCGVYAGKGFRDNLDCTVQPDETT
jgi:hypothetical protein